MSELHDTYVDYRTGWEELYRAAERGTDYFREKMGSVSDNYMLLYTCNRIEMIYVSERPLALDGFRHVEGEDVVRRVFRIAAGLESMSVGENEVLGQLRHEYEEQVRRGQVRGILSTLCMRAISLGKRVRTETGISSGKSSVFDIAADVVASELGSTGLPVLVIGSGRAASSVYNVLMSLGFTDVTACSAGQVASLRRSFSAAVAALRPDEGKIDPSSMEALRASKVIVDISNPAAVVDDGMGRCRYMPDLAQHALEMRASKARDVARAEAMVEEAVQRFMVELNRYQVDEVISSMFRYAEEVRRSEVSRFLKEVSGGSSIDSALESMTRAITSKALRPVIEALREGRDGDVLASLRTALERRSFDGEHGEIGEPVQAGR